MARFWKPAAATAIGALVILVLVVTLDRNRGVELPPDDESAWKDPRCKIPALRTGNPLVLLEGERARDVYERRAIADDPRQALPDDPVLLFPEAAEGDHIETEYRAMKGDSEFVRGRVSTPGIYDTMGVGGGGGGGGRFSGRTGGRMVASAPVRKESADGAIFQATGVNPKIRTAAETTSTFGLDVDTASYTVARSYLQSGVLPPPEAVRVEEFVNYFRYADPKPPKGAFQVLLEAAPSPFDPTLHLLRIAVQAKEITEDERKDCILTFVIDVSGSMTGEHRLGLVQRSLRALVDRLRPTDKVGIVIYGTDGRKLLDPTLVSRRAEILGIINDLHTEGSTNLEAGVTIGYELAAKHFKAKATNRVIICTDGVANNGVTDPELLLKNVAAKASKGIWLSVLGFGMGNLNDHLMEKLADKGNGNYAYIDDFKEAKKIFTEKLVGMMEVVAADAKLQVEFDATTVAEFRLLGYEKRLLANKDFRNDKVDAGEVGANHHVTALYEIRLVPGAEGRLATVRLRYREPDTKEVLESQESLGRGQVLADAGAASASYRLAAAAAAFAEVLRNSPAAKAVKLQSIWEQAVRASADLDRTEETEEFAALVRKASTLKK